MDEERGGGNLTWGIYGCHGDFPGTDRGQRSF